MVKSWFEGMLVVAACAGVAGALAYVYQTAIVLWWGHNWWWIVGIVAIVTAQYWWENVCDIVARVWDGFRAITDYIDTKKLRQEHYMLLAESREQMRQGFDTGYKNTTLGFEISMHNPYVKAQIQQLNKQELLAPVLPKAPDYSQVDSLITDERLVLCYTEDGPVFGTVADLLSMCVVGKPGRGKSTALLYYILILLKAGAEVWIWDPHSGLNELGYGLNYCDDLGDIEQSCPKLHGILEQRRKLWKEKKQVMHPLLLLVDEMPVIADYEIARAKEQKALGKEDFFEYDQSYRPSRLLKKFVLEARKWNCYVILSGQALPAEVLSTLTRDNLSSRVVFESCPMHAKMAGLQKEQIDSLLPSLKGAGPGVAVMDVSRWSKPVLAAIPNTTVEDLRAFIDHGRVVESYGRADVEQSYEEPAARPDENNEDFFSAHEQRFEKLTTDDLEDSLDEPVEPEGDPPTVRPYPMMNEAQAAQFCVLYPFMGIEKALDGIEGCNHRHRDHARELIERHELRRKKA